MSFTEKELRFLPPVVIAGRHVKRYEVVTPGLVIDDRLREAAAGFLPNLYPDFPDESTPPASFMTLHRGPNGMYLNAYNWVWDNVVHCRTAAAGDQPFLGSFDEDLTRYTELTKPLIGCVWELPPLAHERSAWVRHILEKEEPDLDAYLLDGLPDGPVGASSGAAFGIRGPTS